MTNYEKKILELQSKLSELKHLYGSNKDGMLQLERYIHVVNKHKENFNVADNVLFCISAPGRIEVSGNHTDHNHGKVLAAAVNKDALACVSKRHDNRVIFISEGFGKIEIDLTQLEFNEKEVGTTASIIRGVAYKMKNEGFSIGGFDAYVHSTVLSGSGLSSSAAIENLISTIFETLFNEKKLNPILKAKIGQFAENQYFGKPSGLLDQSASAIGGLVYMDYATETPLIKNTEFDFASHGYAIVVVNTNSSHDDLTPAYAAIPQEMKAVAKHFGKQTLQEISIDDVLNNINELRAELGERPILRAMHFFAENQRVENLMCALESKNIPNFLSNIVASGQSSFMYLQNIYANEKNQPISLALALAELVLKGKGAWRVHGGGFAGTTLNFVPQDLLEQFVEVIENTFGKGTCFALNIRPVGSAVL